MSQGSAFLAWTGLVLGGTAIAAAYKGNTWLSEIQSTLNPAHFSPKTIPSQTLSSSAFTDTAGNPTDDPHAAAVAYATSKLGDPYLWGAAGPNRFDCSGLTMMAMNAAGYRVVHNAMSQWLATRKYSIGKTTTPPPGCLVFFGPTPGAVTHCGLSIGGGQMIEAPHTGDVVKVFSIAQEKSYLRLIDVTDPLSRVHGQTTPQPSNGGVTYAP